MAFQRRSNLVRAKTSRQMVWLAFEVDRQTVAANTQILSLVLNAAALALRPFTVVRTRAEILWTSDQQAATEGPFGAVGDIVVSDQASAAGAASVPDPLTDGDGDWFTYQPLIVKFQFASGVGFHPDAGAHFSIDSKAMRKVGINDDLITVVTNGDSTTGAEFSYVGRTLVKLH